MTVLDAFSASLLPYVAAALTVFLSAKIVYRLKLHPLAAFPGPRLAAVTSMYGGFYDLSFSSSSYVKELPALHAKYGQSTIRVFLDLFFSDEDRTNYSSLAQ